MARIFLCHASEDKAQVREVYHRLRAIDGCEPWLDEEDLLPGQDWDYEIKRALRTSDFILIFLSRSSVARRGYVQREMKLALDAWQEVPESTIHTIPVRIDACDVPESFRRYQWVNLFEPNGFDRIVRAIRVESPRLPGERATAPETNLPKGLREPARQPTDPVFGPNPYQGLSAFTEKEADRFFGREQLTQELWEKFRTLHDPRPGEPSALRLLPILGPSGSGKSSVARAGLIPELARRPLPGLQSPRVAVVESPGTDPVEALALALARIALNGSTLVATTHEFERELRESTAQGEYNGLRFIAEVLSKITGSPLIILIDQFEEIYSLCDNDDERDIFVGNVLHAAANRAPRVSIILTLRSNFLGHTERHPALNRAITSPVVVPVMSTDELRRAIAEPAARANHPIDTATVELLIADTNGREGALPLLQFALTRIWQGMTERIEPVQTLQRIGGVGGALAGEAQHLYKSLDQTRGDREIARRAFVALVRLGDPGEGTPDTRRRVKVADLVAHGEDPERVLEVLRVFASPGARLITLGEDTAEITHEALFTHWETFRTWIEADRDDLRFHLRLADAARHWADQERPDGSLWRPPDLVKLCDFHEQRGHDMTTLEMEFFHASLDLQERERVDREEAEARLAQEAEARRQAEERARRERELRQQRHELFQLFGNVPLWAGLLCGLTRMPLTWIFGSLIDPPGAPVEFANGWLKPFMHGFFGTWLGGIFVVFALGALPPDKEDIPLHRIMWLIAAGIGWGFIVALVVGWSTHPHRAVGGWAYFITGTCWGVGLALGTKGGNRLGRTSADPLKIWRYRLWGGGCGAFCLLLLPLLVIGLGWGNKPNLLQRTWGESFQQSLSVSAVLIWFYWQQRRFPPPQQDE